MKRLAGAVAIGAVLRLSPLGEPASFVTIAQAEAHRSPIDTASAAVSADGRYIAFISAVQLVPADTNRQRDIYVLDRTNGEVTLESGSRDRGAVHGDVDHPSISADGRWLVYNLPEHIVVHDRREGATRILSEGHDPVISLDGRFVVFTSSAMNLVSGKDANGTAEDVYLADLRSGALCRISVDNFGAQPSVGSSMTPSISSDGRYVAFSSTAPLGAASNKGVSHVYVRDTQLNTTKPIASGWKPVISAGGNYVAFVSAVDTLVRDDRNDLPDVFLADVQTGTIELISRTAKGRSGNGASLNPALSSDGRFIVFQSEAADLVCASRCVKTLEDINLLWDVFIFDRQLRTTSRLSSDPSATWMETSVGPAMDATGAVVAFSSRHPIDLSDKANDFDLFIRQLAQP
jgi:Tol biopolymer transport system component